MRLTKALIATLGLAACSEPEPPATPVAPAPVVAQAAPIPAADLYVLAVGGNGFRADMGLSGLRRRYGDAAVVSAQLPLGEGKTEAGAVIEPNDPSHRAYVYFVAGNPDGAISAIYLRDLESSWSGPLGLKMGMTSADLNRLNGKPFRFLGFDWDYGGYVSNWIDGNLSQAFLEPGRLAVRLAPPTLPEGSQRVAGYPQGEGEFPSDLPQLREQPAVVVEIGLSFAPE